LLKCNPVVHPPADVHKLEEFEDQEDDKTNAVSLIAGSKKEIAR
jgi:hypothetical protein